MPTSVGRVALVVTLVVGCGGTPPTLPPAVPTGTAAAATPLPTATDAPAVTQRFEFEDEAVVDSALAGTNDKYINPGAVIEREGVLHMFPNSFSDWPGRMRIPHLTSTDGIDWALDEKAELIDTDDVDRFPMADPGIDVSTGYVADDGTWVLYFSTVSVDPWTVWRMTAPTPRGPWTVGDAPVLAPGEAGAFDANGVTWPAIVRVGDRWAMYYGAVSKVRGRADGIGVAFSDDGIAWTREPEPVLLPTEHWEFGGVDRPRVVATGDGLLMVYAGLDLNARGLATSPDGLAWSKVPGPTIDAAAFPIIGGAWDCALVVRNGELEYFLEIGPQTTRIFRSTLAWP
jgi:predicted GH43/DUF377 family glycosyl hydrolase